MEIKVTYSDYEKTIKEARIDFGEDKYIDLSFIEENVDKEEEVECPPIEEEGETPEEKKVVIETECEEEDKITKIVITSKDESLSLEMDNIVDYGEITKIIALLQRMAKQI